MEKDRSTRVLSIIAMVLAIAGLTLGFAVFSATLNIQFGDTTVQGDEKNFSVKLSATATAATTEPVATAVTPSSGPTALEPTLNDTTISGLGATFTKPGEKVTYTFYAVNDGEFDAFLKSIEVANADSGEKAVVCSANPGTDTTMVANACNGIKMTVTVDGEATAITSTTAATTSPVASPSSHVITKGNLTDENSHTITVDIEYLTSSAIADGPFTVKFGNVKLNYSTQA